MRQACVETIRVQHRVWCRRRRRRPWRPRGAGGKSSRRCGRTGVVKTSERPPRWNPSSHFFDARHREFGTGRAPMPSSVRPRNSEGDRLRRRKTARVMRGAAKPLPSVSKPHKGAPGPLEALVRAGPWHPNRRGKGTPGPTWGQRGGGPSHVTAASTAKRWRNASRRRQILWRPGQERRRCSMDR